MYIQVDPSKFILFTIANDDDSNLSKIRKFLPNIMNPRIQQPTFLQFLSSMSETRTPTLPKYRNPEKDTAELLFASNARIDYAYQLLCQYPDATHIAYIDISVPDVIDDLSLLSSIAPLETGEVDMPGYDSPAGEPNLDSVYWHITDKYYSGGRDAIIRLWHNYIRYLPEIVRSESEGLSPGDEDIRPGTKHNIHLSWWMNIIGTVEIKSGGKLWKWRHCKNYNDIFFFPKRLSTVSITPCNNLPLLDGLHPSSISLYKSMGKTIKNVRYVNYNIRPSDKTYVFPTSNHNCITSNVCVFDDGTYIEMKTDVKRPICNTRWQGLEDIRIYSDVNVATPVDNVEDLKFVATSSMWNADNTLKITLGTYDSSTGTCRNLKFINSPVGAYCEKNWIPLPGERNKFIYSWDPYRIVEICDDDSDNSRIVKTSKLSSEAFINARGSTLFIDDAAGGGDYVGIIHRTDSHANYFHMFVWLDRITKMPKYRSDYFYFTTVGIEYCIGLDVIGPGKYKMFVSVYDNNPVEIICENVRKIGVPALDA